MFLRVKHGRTAAARTFLPQGQAASREQSDRDGLLFSVESRERRRPMISKLMALAAGAALMIGVAASAEAGTGLFATPGNAHSVCGPDKVVWVMLKGGKYYREGSAGYEKAKDQKTGAYTCEKKAKAEGGYLAPDGR
jgi:hypothetical protein